MYDELFGYLLLGNVVATLLMSLIESFIERTESNALQTGADIPPELISFIEFRDDFKYRRRLRKLTFGKRAIAAEVDPSSKERYRENKSQKEIPKPSLHC